jgi:hypothetical protein
MTAASISSPLPDELTFTDPLAAIDNAKNEQQHPFRLMDLPAELWTKIGKMAIEDRPVLDPCVLACIMAHADTTHQGHGISSDELLMDEATRGSSLSPPPITQSCSALRSELLPIFYKTAIRLGLSHSCTTCVRGRHRYLEAIGPEARAHIRLQSIDVFFAGSEPVMPRYNDIFGFDVNLAFEAARDPPGFTAFRQELVELNLDAVFWNIKIVPDTYLNQALRFGLRAVYRTMIQPTRRMKCREARCSDHYICAMFRAVVRFTYRAVGQQQVRDPDVKAE